MIEPTLRYTARDLAGMAANDDDPGRVSRARHFRRELYNYFDLSDGRDALLQSEKDAFEAPDAVLPARTRHSPLSTATSVNDKTSPAVEFWVPAWEGLLMQTKPALDESCSSGA